MDLSTFYIGVSSTKLADANNSNGMRDAALNAWTHLSQYTLVFLMICVAFGIGLAVYYYTGYNNQPKRHYLPKKWLFVGLKTVGLVFILTIALAIAFQRPDNIEGLLMMEIQIAFDNLLYAAGLYFFVSVIWCNFPQLPTNAYRYFKI